MRALVLGFAAGVGWLQMREELPGAMLLLGLCMVGIMLCGFALQLAALRNASSLLSACTPYFPFA
ncbi:MAG TPA: hypothetical protein VF797_18820, partial [Noviherbaspirillum sp.]